MNGLYRIITSVIVCIISVGSAPADKKSSDRVLLTSFYPMYIMAINVADGVPGLKVVNMTRPQTGCLHDYQLTPNDLKQLSNSWAFIINGGGMESFVGKAMSQQPRLTIIDASKGIEMIRNDLSIDHKEHDEHSDGKETFNAHVWVSVSDAILQVANIRDGLIALDSANAAIYKKNGDAYIEMLQALKEKMHAGLANITSRNIITFHEAFPYFAREFNLNIVAVIEREPGSEPSAAELAQTIQIIKKHNVKALFTEPQYSQKAAQTIARETGSKLYVLDPAVTGEMTPDAYIHIMESNLAVLQKALQ